MKTATVAGVKAGLDKYLKASEEVPVVVTRNGKAIAVLIGVHDKDELERILLAHSPKLTAILDAADRRLDDAAGIPHEQFWSEMESRNRDRQRKVSGKKRLAKR